jgi:hypothetical protein
LQVGPPTPLSGFQPNNRCLKRYLGGRVRRPHLNAQVRQLPGPPPGWRCPCSVSGTASGPHRNGGTGLSPRSRPGGSRCRRGPARCLAQDRAPSQSPGRECWSRTDETGERAWGSTTGVGSSCRPGSGTPARSSGSVLVAARAAGTPAVVVAATGVLEGIVSRVAEAKSSLRG